jgi:hypothetical protein
MRCRAKSTGVACRPEQAARDEAKRVKQAWTALRYREVESLRTGIEKSRKVRQSSGERLVRKDESCCGNPTRGWGALFRFEEQG